MLDKIHRRLPVAAAVALAVALATFTVVTVKLGKPLAESGETRRAVDAAVSELQALRPSSLDEAGFRQAAEKLTRSRYVYAVVLIRSDGHIAFSTAGFAPAGSVHDLALDETRRVLSEMPDGFLTPLQQTALLAASTLQREGDHNDIFRQMIRPVRSAADADLGFIGVSYAATVDSGAFPGLTYAVALLLLPVALLVYWLALPWWVFLDAKRRKEPPLVWAMFVLIGNLVALFAYLLTRRPSLAPSGTELGLS